MLGIAVFTAISPHAVSAKSVREARSYCMAYCKLDSDKNVCFKDCMTAEGIDLTVVKIKLPPPPKAPPSATVPWVAEAFEGGGGGGGGGR